MLRTSVNDHLQPPIFCQSVRNRLILKEFLETNVQKSA